MNGGDSHGRDGGVRSLAIGQVHLGPSGHEPVEGLR